MRLTTKGRFAVTALLDLAMQRSAHPVTLVEWIQKDTVTRARDTEPNRRP